jgi:cytochrome c peroxidase
MFYLQSGSNTVQPCCKTSHMKMKQTLLITGFALCAIAFQYCAKADNTASGASTTVTTVATAGSPSLPGTPYNYNVALPAHISAALTTSDNTPANNAITNDGATLGRVLFYDKNLSQNKTVSCGSCHRPDLSFSDSAVKSKGFAGGLTTRHSMPLLNVRFYRNGRMFWDERAATLEDQVLQPIQNTTEMGITLTELVSRVSAQTYYPSLFQKAFGNTDVNTDRIAKALAQFVRSIVTTQSKYDLVKQGQATFTADERDGEALFLTAGNIPCAGCHAPPMFITSNPAAGFGLADANDTGINGTPRFKSSSLRNVAVTAPYFHNGSVATLQSVISTQIPAHTVAPQDRAKIIAFLQTLTDTNCIKDVRFSDPFQQ